LIDAVTDRDRFDCVTTRTARFGVALVLSGSLRLGGSDMSQDTRSIDGADVTSEALCAFAIQPACECSTCRNYSRSYLHSLLREASVALAVLLITAHIVAYRMALMRSMEEARIT
jgi:queuine tRNA-ribosyltransferase